MKTTITVAINFAAAHRLPEHEGKCSRLHGHTYGLEVTVEGIPQASGPTAGMVMDFADLRERVGELIVDQVDHQLLNEVCRFRAHGGGGSGMGLRAPTRRRPAGGARAPLRRTQHLRGSDGLRRPGALPLG